MTKNKKLLGISFLAGIILIFVIVKIVFFPSLSQRLKVSDDFMEARNELSGTRVALYFGSGMDSHSAIALGRAFLWMGCGVESIDASRIKNGDLDRFDVLACPGGASRPNPWRDLGLEGKSTIARELQPLLKAIGRDKLQRSIFLAHFSEKLGVSAEELASPLAEPERKKPTVAPSSSAPLPAEQRRLLEFLICYPAHIESFLAAGLEMVCNHPQASQLVQAMKSCRGEDFAPEILLGLVEDGGKSLVTEILMIGPSCLPEQAEETAQAMQAWLKRKAMKGEKRALVEKINEAHQANNLTLLMELIEKKKELDEAFRK